MDSYSSKIISLVGYAVGLLSLYVLYHALRFLAETVWSLWTPLCELRGPANPSFLTGLEFEFAESEDAVLIEAWVEKFGLSFKYPSFAAKWDLITLDPRALAHVLSNSDTYPKPDAVRKMLLEILGDGLIIAEGETHKRQRRILNPSFSAAQIRELTPIFFEKASQLRDIWIELLQTSIEQDSSKLDAYPWLARATLDMIGLAGFGYSFDALLRDDNELAVALRELFRVQLQVRLLTLLRAWVPVLRFILPDKDAKLRRTCMSTMRRVGMGLIERKKREALQSIQSEKTSADAGRSTLSGRDLLSSMIRANMATELSPAHRLSDEEVLNQITTFMLAGHETTSSSVIWALHVLSRYSDVQTKLREELLSVMDATPSMDDLNVLPYLDLFVREVLRLYAPLRDTVRQATVDDTIPLAYPIVDAKGRTRDSINVRAGDTIVSPILAMNRSKLLWGEDAHEFRPERFQDLPDSTTAIPGVWSHMMSFLGGSHACIGYRFSIIEMKAILFTLVRTFVFEPADPTVVILKKTAVVTRPIVKGEEDKGAQLPLRLRLVDRSL